MTICVDIYALTKREGLNNYEPKKNNYDAFRWKYCKGRFGNIENFVKEVPADNILFGFLDGCFFENHFKDTDEFEDNKQQIMAAINQKKAWITTTI